MVQVRRTRSGMASVMAGCFQCNGYDGLWFTRNALGVAARHHDATGHTTWAEQVITVTYGNPDLIEHALFEHSKQQGTPL